MGPPPHARPYRDIPDWRLTHESERSSRIALSFGTAAGAAVIAASFSMGTAPKADADASDADAVSSLVGALDPSALSAASVADTALPAATETVPVADAISYLIDALDPNQFTSTGAPAGVFGLVGYYLDTYLFGPNGIFPSVDALLDPSVEELVSSLPASAASAATVGVAIRSATWSGRSTPARSTRSTRSLTAWWVRARSSDLGRSGWRGPTGPASQMAIGNRNRARPTVSP